jgi:hypothetical protein
MNKLTILEIDANNITDFTPLQSLPRGVKIKR